jgi:energy-coupling factor transporter ATP-binding protein EcfA2
MSEVKIAFKNYKLLKEGEINLHEGSIFFIQGPNNVGKTSMLTLLQSIMEVKDDTVNPVTFGQQEGFSTGTIPGADGLIYQYRYDFNIDGKTKFQFIAPDGKVVKSITEMRAIFNYTHFTLEEFFEWSKTEPGRKKQREIFMGLLKEKERNDVLEIDGMIHPTKGTLIESRKEVNRDVDFLKKKIDGIIITPDQQKLISNKELLNTTFENVKKEKEDLEAIISKSGDSLERIKELKEGIVTQESVYSNTCTDYDNDIKELERQLEEKKRKYDEYKIAGTKTIQDNKDKLTELQKSVDEKYLAEVKLKLDGDGTPEKPGLIKRLEAGQKKKDELIALEVLVDQKAKDEKEYKTKKEEADKYETKIETLRATKKSIIQNSENIPLGWSLNDDYLTIDNVPFMETDLSKSQATKAIAELMIRINKCPIMLMGDAESLGYEILDELDIYAKEQGKIMIFAEHVRQAEELQLICYDEIDHISKTTKKDLF